MKRQGRVRLWVQVQPRASRTEVAGRHGDAIKIRLKAPPVDNRANSELRTFLSQLLDLPPRQVRLVRGRTNRRKLLELEGVDAKTVERLLLSSTGS